MGSSYSTSVPPVADFFPPTPQAYSLLFQSFKSIPLVLISATISIVLWIPQVARLQAMGRSSLSRSRFNLPGRYAWAAAEMVGPLNMLFIIYTLPSRLSPPPPPLRHGSSPSLLGTGMPFFYHELLALLYLLHYLNRAIITPLFLAPSMSPIAFPVSLLMVAFQFINSSCLACWIVYHDAANSHLDNTPTHPPSPISLTSNPVPLLCGLPLFLLGLYGNISAETTLFSLRRAAAHRRAKSEGKPLHPSQVSYAKVYAIPEPAGWFRHVMYPHYVMEWVEWIGYWVIGGLAGLGWSTSQTPAIWFVANELATMMPRALDGRRWYESKFGPRRLAGRRAVVPGLL